MSFIIRPNLDFSDYDWLKEPAEDIDLRRAIEDFPYFARYLLKIRAKDRRLKTLNIRRRPAQMILDRAVNETRKAGRPFEGVILKSRRQGISTYCEGRIFHGTITHENTDSIIIAQDEYGVDLVFSYSKLFYDCLPPEWKPLKRYSSKRELVFENPDEKSRSIEPGLRSSIRVFKARSDAAVRSRGSYYIHFSEVAFFPEGVAVACINAALDTIQDPNNYAIFYESTANGVGGWFYDTWQEITEPGYRGTKQAFFFPWYIDPDNRLPLDEETARALEANLDDEEKELRQKYGLSLEQLWWRRHKIDQKMGDMDLFRQEFPSSPQEAFIVSGSPVFSREIVAKWIAEARDPLFRGEIETIDGQTKLVEHSEGSLEIWEMPLRNAEYVMGVDVGGEDETNDLAAITVLRRSYPKGLAKVVAVWHANIDAVELADVVIRLAKLYNEALVAIEINNAGITTQNEVKKRYFNLYMWQYFDRFGISQSKKLGWVTSSATKPLLLSFGRYAVHSGLVESYSEKLAEEMKTFVRHGVGAAGEGSSHDDIVMSFLIALHVLHTTDMHDIGEIAEQPPSLPSSRVDEIIDKASIDTDLYEELYGEGEEEIDWLSL
jgi:hypothetical protein